MTIHTNIPAITLTLLDYSGMAEWLRCSLAEWKVPGSNLTMGKVPKKVSVKKFQKKKEKKKPASYPLLA